MIEHSLKTKEKTNFNEQFRIGRVQVGGIKSCNPTTLIGSIFYMRHKIVKDEETGVIDEKAAEKLITDTDNLADQLSMGLMLDVIGTTPQALINYVKFIKKVSDVPILLNSTTADVRISAVRELAEMDMLDNIVYNSINPHGTDEEIDVLSEVPIDAAVVQVYSMKTKKPDWPIKAFFGHNNSPGIIDKVRRTKIKNIMVDIPALDLASIGTIPYSVEFLRQELSVPIGTAPANATYTSEWTKTQAQKNYEILRMLNANVCSYLIANNCNFLFFGPLEGADRVFQSCALADAMNIYGARHLGLAPASDNHPIYKVF